MNLPQNSSIIHEFTMKLVNYSLNYSKIHSSIIHDSLIIHDSSIIHD